MARMHGRESTYAKHACRCEECTTAHREYEREYRRKRRATRARAREYQLSYEGVV